MIKAEKISRGKIRVNIEGASVPHEFMSIVASMAQTMAEESTDEEVVHDLVYMVVSALEEVNVEVPEALLEIANSDEEEDEKLEEYVNILFKQFIEQLKKEREENE